MISRPTGPTRGVVLLIPGFTGSKEDFRAVLPLLAALGWVSATFDLRGQYESPGPDDPAGYEMSEFVADTVAVSEQLSAEHGHHVHLVGHSFGGLVARATVQHLLTGAEHPSRDLVASLTLLSSGPGALPDDVQPIAKQLLDALSLMTLTQIWQYKEAAERASGVEQPDPAAYELARRRFVGCNPLALAGKARLLIESPDNVDQLAPLLAAGRPPTLVAYGSDDNRWTPAQQDQMARRLGARRVCWWQTAHSPAIEHPTWCAAVLEGFFSDVLDCDAGPVPETLSLIEPTVGLDLDPVGYTANVELRLPVVASPPAVGQARRTIARQLQAWGLTDQIDDLQLIVSELVTNALRHVGGPIELLLLASPETVRVEVRDSDMEDMPTQAASNSYAFGGRGVPLVAAVATRWGVDVFDDGKAVWAEISIKAS